MKAFRFTFVLLSLFTLVACKNNKDSGSAFKPGPPQAKSAEEALSWLVEDDRKNFEAWKLSIVKDCSATQAFNVQDNSPHESGVDLAAIYSRSGNSLLLETRTGEKISLGRPIGLAGLENTHVQNSVVENGRVLRGVDAEAHRNGSYCEFSIFGQVVYKTALYAKMGVVAHFSPDRGAQPALAVGGDAPVRRNDRLLISAQVFTNPLAFALASDDRSFTALAEYFSLQLRDARDYFTTQGSSLGDLEMTMQIGGSNILPFNRSSNQLLGRETDFTSLLAGNFDKEFFVQFRAKPVDNFGVINFADINKRWALKGRLAFTGNLGGAGGHATLTALESTPVRTFDEQRTTNCFLARFASLNSLVTTPNKFYPSFAETLSPCRTDSASPVDAVFNNSASRDQSLGVLENFADNPDRRPSYFGDWRDVVVARARWFYDNKIDFRLMLDPQGAHPFVTQAQSYTTQLLSPFVNKPEFQILYGGNFFDMAFDWAIRGNFVAPTKISAITTTVERFGKLFNESTNSLLTDFRNDPASPNANLSLSVASSTTDAQLNLYQTLLARVDAWDLHTWAAPWRDSFLQSPVDFNTLTAWNETLQGAQDFVSRDDARPHKPISTNYARRRRELLTKALEENWTAGTFNQFEALMIYGNVHSNCTPYRDGDFSTLANCVGLDKLSRADGKILNPRNRRYGDLAQDFASHDQKLRSVDSFLPRTLQNEFWKPVWASCDDTEFNSRRQTLQLKVDEEQRRGRDLLLEREIEALLTRACT